MGTVTAETPYRELGDTTREAFRAELAALGSPVLAEADAVYDAARPHTRLWCYHAYVEKRYDTHYRQLPPSAKNALALKPRGYPEETGSHNGYATFAGYADNARALLRRFDDADLPYAGDPAMSLLAYTTHYCGPADVDPDTGAACDPDEYCAVGLGVVNRLPPLDDPEEPVSEIVFGRVPHPASEARWVTDAQNSAWDYLGPRTVKGVVWHRMVGTLNGTDGYFRDMADAQQTGSGGLTDYGVGVAAVDGSGLAGRIYRWNDPLGLAHQGCSVHRAGWASGTWRNPPAYGDGEAFVAEYGVNAINRDQVSVEISGYAATPLDEASRQAVAAITAYWADQAKLPWDEFPMWHDHGYSFVRWHEEFGPKEPDGSDKRCPFDVVKAETDALMERTRGILKQHQTGAAPEPSPEPPGPGVHYPPGMDEDLARRWFGEVSVGGKRYAYDPGQPVSTCWLDEGTETGCWPRIVGVETYDTRSYWRFEGGLTIWRPNDSAKPAVLKG